MSGGGKSKGQAPGGASKASGEGPALREGPTIEAMARTGQPAQQPRSHKHKASQGAVSVAHMFSRPRKCRPMRCRMCASQGPCSSEAGGRALRRQGLSIASTHPCQHRTTMSPPPRLTGGGSTTLVLVMVVLAKAKGTKGVGHMSEPRSR